MEQPPHPMRLGDEHDYYARGPELLRDAPVAAGGQGERTDPTPAGAAS
jgi:NADH-quinone oxidoreductase subunit I